MFDIGIYHWLTLSTALFSIGVYGAISRRNLIMLLISLELVLNAAAINFVAFYHYMEPSTGAANSLAGIMFPLFIIAIAAAEAAIGLAIVVRLFRLHDSTSVEKISSLQG